MNMNFIKKTLLASAFAAVLTGCGGDKAAETTAADSKSLAITAIVEHSSLDAVRAGALEQLAAEGYKEGENLKVTFQTAQGNIGTAGQIAKEFVSDNPDAVLAIATPSAQALASATENNPQLPIVFSAVTDPVEAKLVDKLDGGGKNITGASDKLPLEPQAALIKELFPNVKAVGFVYNPGEINSTIALKALRAQLEPMGIKVEEAAAQKSSDVGMAANSLAGKVDVIYTSTDNMIVSAYEALYQAAKAANIPIIASSTGEVERGAIAALGVNYHDLGIESGKIIARIFKGEKAGDIAVYTPQNLDLYISKKYAAELGVELPPAVVERATKVFE